MIGQNDPPDSRFRQLPQECAFRATPFLCLFMPQNRGRMMAAITVGAASLQALGALRLGRKTRSGSVHRTGAPVLRDSVEAGTFEDVFFASPVKGETDSILRAARRALDAGKRLRRDARADGRQLSGLERHLAALTSGTVRVLEEILTLARLNAGRVYPTYEYLAEATSLGRATIARALHVLDAIGFVIRQRRFKRVEAQGPGPRYEQTSNVYRAYLPSCILPYLPRWMRPAPIPDDTLQHEADRIEDTKQMLSRLGCRDLALAVIADGPLAKVLAKLGAAVDDREREYQNDPQPLKDSYISGNDRVGLAGQRPNA